MLHFFMQKHCSACILHATFQTICYYIFFHHQYSRMCFYCLLQWWTLLEHRKSGAKVFSERGIVSFLAVYVAWLKANLLLFNLFIISLRHDTRVY